MKTAFLLFTLIAMNTFAQTANIKDIPVGKDTNISITNEPKAISKNYEIVDDVSDIAGDPETLSKDARFSWKKACDEWKKETKEMNKDNKIISLNCGQPTCDKSENVTTTCKSKSKLKVKVRVD